MGNEEEPKPSAFRVTDRRRFDREGNLRDEAQEPGPEPRPQPPPPEASAGSASRSAPEASVGSASRSAPEASAGSASRSAPQTESPGPSPRQEAESDAASDAPGGRIGFPELIMSLATTALAYLGHQPGDSQRVPGPVNLPMAAQNIDIIAMLKEKTQGNLTAQEAELIDSVLYDLRTLFVQTAQQQR